MADDERIDIEVVMRDMTSPSAENVKRKIDGIEDSSDNADDSLQDLGTTTDKTGRKWRRFGVGLRRSKKDIDDTTESVKGTTKAVKELGVESEKAEKKVSRSAKGMKGSFRGLFGWLGKMRSMLMFGIKWGVIADGIGFLGTAIKGLGAAGYAAVAGLSPMVGVLGSLPGMTATLLQSLGVVKLATSGLGKAIEVMANPAATIEEYNEATKNLHRNQIKFAQSVATSLDVWKALRKEVAGRFFDNVGPLYLSLTKKYQPLFNKHLGKTADIWNDMIHSAGDYLESKNGFELIGDIMDHNNRAMEAGAGGMGQAVRMLMIMTRAAGPMVTQMARDWTGMMTKGANWAEQNEDQLQDFFDRSWVFTKRVGDALGDLFMGLYNIGKLSAPLSRYMGKSSEEGLANFRMWTESKKGRRDIRRFFRGMRPVVKELALWVGTLWNAVDEIALDDDTFVKWSKGLREDVVPALIDLIQAVQGWALPVIIKAAQMYENLKEAKVTGGVGRALDLFVDALLKLTDAAAELPDTTKNLLGFATGVYAGYKILNRGAVGRGINALTGGRLGKSGVTPVFVTNWAMMAGAGGIGGAGRRGAAAGAATAAGGRRAAGRAKVLGARGPKGTRRARMTAGQRIGRLGSPAVLASMIAGQLMGTSGNKGVAAAGNTLTGAAAGGSMFGLPGAVIGGSAGLLYSLYSNQKGDRKKRESVRAGKGSIPEMFAEYETLHAKLREIGKARDDLLNKGVPSSDMAVQDLTTGYHQWKIELDKLDGSFKNLTNMTVPQYKEKLETLPPDLQTKIETPGLIKTEKQVMDYLARLDMTPKQKKTMLELFGMEATMADLRTLQQELEATRRAANINVAVNYGSEVARNGVPVPRFAGGDTKAGRSYLIGEVGPEAWFSKSGGMKMFGLNGPEIAKPGSGAVVPASATSNPFGGNTGNAPDWAVAALQRANKGKGQSTAERRGEGGSGAPVTVKIGPVYATSDVDVERAVKKALRDARIEEEERT